MCDINIPEENILQIEIFKEISLLETFKLQAGQGDNFIEKKKRTLKMYEFEIRVNLSNNPA